MNFIIARRKGCTKEHIKSLLLAEKESIIKFIIKYCKDNHYEWDDCPSIMKEALIKKDTFVAASILIDEFTNLLFDYSLNRDLDGWEIEAMKFSAETNSLLDFFIYQYGHELVGDDFKIL